MLEGLARDEPGDPTYRSNLAAAYDRLADASRGTGLPDRAEEARGKARSHRAASPPRLAAAPENELGFAGTNGYSARPDLAGSGEPSEKVYLETHAVLEQQAHERPGDAARQNRLAVSHGRLGRFYAGAGRLREAVAAFGAARSAWERLAGLHPGVTYYRSELAKAHDRLGLTLARLGRLGEAEATYRTEAEVLVRLTGERPDVPEYRHLLALCWSLLGDLHATANRPGPAADEFLRAHETLTRLSRDYPEIPAFQQSLGQSHVHLSNVDRQAGRWARPPPPSTPPGRSSCGSPIATRRSPISGTTWPGC